MAMSARILQTFAFNFNVSESLNFYLNERKGSWKKKESAEENF